MQVAVKFNRRQIADAAAQLREAGVSVPKAFAAAINDTAKDARSRMSKRIRQWISIKKKALDRTLKISHRATARDLHSGIHLEKTKGIPLQYFGARQTAAGVTFRLSKLAPRQLIAHAFMGPKPGVLAATLHGGVFIRLGKARLPIEKLRGDTPYDVFVRTGMLGPTTKETTDLLKKNVDQRTRFAILKARGEI